MPLMPPPMTKMVCIFAIDEFTQAFGLSKILAQQVVCPLARRERVGVRETGKTTHHQE
jgi:hypothetical protein